MYMEKNMNFLETDFITFFNELDENQDGKISRDDILRVYKDKNAVLSHKSKALLSLFIHKDKVDTGIFNYFATCDNIFELTVENFIQCVNKHNGKISLMELNEIKKYDHIHEETLFYLISRDSERLYAETMQDAFLYNCYPLQANIVNREISRKTTVFDFLKKYICINEAGNLQGA